MAEDPLTPPERLREDWRMFRRAMEKAVAAVRGFISMQIWREVFTAEKLFGWAFIGAAISLLVGSGVGFLGITYLTKGLDYFTAAEICFTLAAIVMFAKIAHIAVTTNYPFWERMIFTGLLFAIVGIGLVEVIRWLSTNRPSSNATQQLSKDDIELQSRDPVLMVEPEYGDVEAFEPRRFELTLYNVGASDLEQVEIYEDYYILVDAGPPLTFLEAGLVPDRPDSIITSLKSKDRAKFHIDYSRAYPDFMENVTKPKRYVPNQKYLYNQWIVKIKFRYRRSFDGAIFTSGKIFIIGAGDTLFIESARDKPPYKLRPGYPAIPQLAADFNADGWKVIEGEITCPDC